MANLRELRSRIASIKSTRKITSAMKMVAASRLRQSQEAIAESGYFAASLGRIVSRLIKTISFVNSDDKSKGITPRYEMPRIVAGDGEDMRHLVIVFASSRGLCGGFNMNIVKKAAQFIEHLQSQGRVVRLICIGTKATELLRDQFGRQIVATFPGRTNVADQLVDAENIATHLISMFEKGTIDACSVVYNHFHSAISQEVRIRPIVPMKAAHILQPFTGENPWGFLVNENEGGAVHLQRPSRVKNTSIGKGKGFVRDISKGRAKAHSQYKTTQEMRLLNADVGTTEEQVLINPLEYDFEPENPVDLLNAIIPEVLAALIFRTSLESSASENGARMTAMDNATNNAADIIDELTLLYNQTRQAMITSELTEIISGAEAL
ncbi:MAG: F0F1 ATP synthase subunit gamma [Alphaproteobacteria bacterium]|nr:F0F1 ATP synthase subunit gamma [Alphaproteobacteria bacterium]MBO4643956.1 F0F1 ATP synthase subunit gamma [Alphaproteobacteria bacterium]